MVGPDSDLIKTTRQAAVDADHEREKIDALIETAKALPPVHDRTSALPLVVEAPEIVPDGVTTLSTKIANVIDAERRGRTIIAGLGLAVIREQIGLDTRAWQVFVERHFPFGLARADELLGRMVHRKSMLRCARCRAEVVCPCGCGMPYQSDHPFTAEPVEPAPEPPPLMSAGERAKIAIAADPTKSNRLIAKEIGVTERTVRRARADAAPDAAPLDDEDEDDPKSAHNALRLRADTAGGMAHYDGPVDAEILESVEYAASQWMNLLQRVKGESEGE
jgi:hypothetical protein